MQKGVSGIRHGELWKLLLRCFGSEILLLAIYWWVYCCLRPLVLLNAFLPLPARDKKISGTALVFSATFFFRRFLLFLSFLFFSLFFVHALKRSLYHFFLYFFVPSTFSSLGGAGELAFELLCKQGRPSLLRVARSSGTSLRASPRFVDSVWAWFRPV